MMEKREIKQAQRAFTEASIALGNATGESTPTEALRRIVGIVEPHFQKCTRLRGCPTCSVRMHAVLALRVAGVSAS